MKNVKSKVTNIFNSDLLVERMSLLSPFIDDTDNKFIFVNRPGEVITKNKNQDGFVFHSVPKLNYAYCYKLAKLVANYSKQRLDESNPMLLSSLPGGERISITIPPDREPGYVTITIRSARPQKLTLKSCINNDITGGIISGILPTADDLLLKQIDFLHSFLEPYKNRAPDVTEAIFRITEEISNKLSEKGPLYSLTSSNPSIWSLIHKHLDAPLNDVIHGYQGIYLKELLDDFSLSAIGKTHPNTRIDINEWAKLKDWKLNLLDWKNLLVEDNQPQNKHLISNADIVLNNIEAWHRNILFAIRSIITPCSDRVFAASLSRCDAAFPDQKDLYKDLLKPCDNRISKKEHAQFLAALESIREFLNFLRILKPQREKDPLLIYDYPLTFINAHPNHDEFCELCWRRTMRAAELIKINNLSIDEQHIGHIWNLHMQGEKDQYIADKLGLSFETVCKKIQVMEGAICKARNSSNRFCYEHDPKDPKSRYYTDKPYKDAFHRELQVLHGRHKSRFYFRFPKPDNTEEQELRKTAYDQVHAGIRSLNNIDKPSLLEDVFTLYSQGMTQSEIARRLHKPRQMVRERMNKIDELIRKRQNEQLIYPESEESWQKTMDSPLVQQVLDLHKKGYTVTDIAKKTDRFRHTIHSVHFWLKHKAKQDNFERPRLMSKDTKEYLHK